MHASTKTGSSKIGTYAGFTQEMYDGQEGDRALGAESNAFLHSAKISSAARRVALKHRMGQFWNKKLAFYRRAPYLLGRRGEPIARDDRCPLCRRPDSSGHILLDCAHKMMQALVIRRHDMTVCQINNSLQKHTKHGSAYTILDACRETELTQQGADAKRLPRWILPEGTTSDEELAKMRPDILRIRGLPPAPTPADIAHAMANKEQYQMELVEVGYCSDTKWRRTVAQKLRQHATLIEKLQAAGWSVDTTAHVIVVGACGAVYLSGQQALEKLGLSKAQCSKLLTRLHLIAVQAMSEISMARRRLERAERRAGVG